MAHALDSKLSTIQSCSINTAFPASAFNAGNLHLVFAGPSNNITLAIDDVSQFAKTRTGLNTWKSVVLGSQFPSHQQRSFQSTMAPSIVVCGEYSYIFWCDTADGQISVVRCRADGSEAAVAGLEFVAAPSQQAITITQATVASNPVAILAPDGQGICLNFLTANKNQFTQGNVTVPPGASLWISCYFKPDDFQPFGSWSGSYTGMLIDDNGTMVKSYNSISAAWFTQGQGAFERDAGAPILSKFFLIVAGYGSKSAVSYVWEVDILCMPTTIDLASKKANRIANNAVIPVPGLGGPSNSLSHGVQVMRDPSGAVIALYCMLDQPNESNALIMIALFSPNTQDKAPNQRNGMVTPQWLPQTKFGNAASACRPCATFVGLPIQRGKSPSIVNPKGATQVFANSLMQAQVMFGFVGSVAASAKPLPLQYFTMFYGTTVTVPQAASATPQGQQPPMVLTAVADTFPYPVPAPNVWEGSSPSGMVDWTACRYDYLVGNQAESEVVAETKLAFGVRAGTMSTEGVGAASEVAISAGAASTFQQLETTVNATVLSVATKGTMVSAENLGIRQQGAYICRGYPALSMDLSFFAGRDNKVHTSAAMPLYWALGPTPGSNKVTNSGDYQTYCYMPGNLSSYLPGSINATMRTLFNNKFPNGTDVFTIGGKDYSEFYTDPNKGYLDYVVEKFGAKCFGASGKLSYLEFTFGSTDNQKAEYQDTSAMKKGWSLFLNSSIYAGLSWGEGFDVWGFGENFQAYVMLGQEFAVAIGGAQGTSKSWGVSLADYLNPLAPGEAYTARMYFLNPSRLWSVELQQFGFDGGTVPNIDFAHSAPLRFLFTVESISPDLSTRLASAPFVPVTPPTPPTSS